MKKNGYFQILLVLLLIVSLNGCLGESPTPPVGKCHWAGVRASTYGIATLYSSFPSPPIWVDAMYQMAAHWSKSTPTAIWLVGVVSSETTGTILQFTAPRGAYDSKIQFNPNVVNHESFLTYFDSQDIKVFLQLEPGFASVTDQITATLKKFAVHNCVAGLAIDVEWYQNAASGSASGSVTDALAQEWETLVQSYNQNYRLLLKHWDSQYFPPNYKGQIIFCCDGQNHSSKTQFLQEHRQMARFAYPNPVIYQIGYPSDQAWWGKYSDAPKNLGDMLINQTAGDQECGVIWVDFSFNQLQE
jgi:hypothetical protein